MKKLKQILQDNEGVQILSRKQMSEVHGGKPITESCAAQPGTFYIWCKYEIDTGGYHAIECWSGYVSELTPGCSTTNTTVCIPQVS